MTWNPPQAYWTREEDNLLVQWRDEDCSFGVIAKRLGRSRNACIGRAHRLGMIGGNPVPRTNLWVRRPRQPPNPCRSHSKPHTPRIVREPIMAELRPIPPDTPWKTTKPLGEPASLMERHPQGCCFIPGDNHVYCNAHKLAELDYCPEHYALTRKHTAPIPESYRPVTDAADRVIQRLAVAA